MAESLQTQALRGVRWTALSTAGTVVLQLAQMIILARLLQPADFGLMAMVLVVIRLGNPIMQAGLGQAVIQAGQLSRSQLSTLYWLNWIAGLVVFALSWVLLPLVAAFFEEPELWRLLGWASLSFLLVPLGSQFQSLLARDLRFDRITVIHLASHGMELLVSVAAARRGMGPFSLVIGYLSRVLLTAGTSLWWGWTQYRPALVFRIREVYPQLRFGGFEAANLLANFFSSQIDKIIIGKWLGADLLGLYAIAWDLVVTPIARINPVITRVAFPVFARIREDRDMLNRYYRRALQALMLVNWPALCGLALVSGEVLTVFYGPEWTGASTCLAILCLASLAKTFANPGASILLARGRSDIAFYWNLFWSVVMALTATLALSWRPSLETAAWAQVGATFGVTWIWHILVARMGGISYKPLLRDQLVMALLVLPMALAVWAAGYLGTSPLEKFVYKVGTGIAVFATLIFLFKPFDLVQQVLRRK